MKKLITITSLILFTIFTIGCSKDDDGPTGGTTTTASTDLIGTWDLDYYIENGTLTEEIICDEQVRYVFSSDGTYTVTTFAGNGTTDCLVAVITNGSWENLGSNSYELTPNGGTSGSALNITFQDDFTKFTSVVSSSRTEVFAKQ